MPHPPTERSGQRHTDGCVPNRDAGTPSGALPRGGQQFHYPSEWLWPAANSDFPSSLVGRPAVDVLFNDNLVPTQLTYTTPITGPCPELVYDPLAAE